MQWALCSLERFGTWTNGTLGQLRLGHACQTLEVVMARVAEVGGAKAKVDSHRAAIATLVLEEICAMLGTHLWGRENTNVRVKQLYDVQSYM